MTMPRRIQRKRTKGWRMPEGAIYVGRPSIWGNPYSEAWLLRFHIDVPRAIELFRMSASGMWLPQLSDGLMSSAQRRIYALHTGWMLALSRHPSEAILTALRGKDLACWCPLSQPCHADVLLEIANS